MLDYIKSKAVFFVLAVIFIASTWALFSPKMFFTHDFIHGVRIAEMSQALKDGHFPVRWSSNFGYGYGMPLFEFYAPFPYYVGSFFYLLGFSLVTSSKLLFLLPTVGTLIASYFLGKSLFGRFGGLVSAALITLAPYRALNVFIRGAVSETWGLMAAIWVLYATVLILKKQKNGWLHLVISLTILFLSHNLVTMMFVPFALLFTLLFLVYQNWDTLLVKKNRSKTLNEMFFTLLKVASGYVLSIGLASFYLIPAMLENDFTLVEQTITGGYFDYSLHFLYIRQFFQPGWGYGGSEWGPNDPLSFFLGFGQLLGVVVVLLIIGKDLYSHLVLKKKHQLQPKRVFLFISLLALCGLAFLMSIMRSKFIWDSIPFFKFIQFPWRFYSVGVIFLGLIGSFFTVFVTAKRYFISAFILLLTICVNATYFYPERYLEDAAGLYYDNPAQVQSHMSGILPDYIPKSLKVPTLPPTVLVQCLPQDSCEKTAELINRTHEKLFEVTAVRSTQVALSIAEYPGWIVEVDGVEQEHQVTPEGTIQVTVEPGYHTIGARFGYTTVRLVADLISAVSVLVLITVLVKPDAKKKKE